MSKALLFLGVVALVSALIEFIINIIEKLKNRKRRRRIYEIRKSTANNFSENADELSRLYNELTKSKEKISYRSPTVLILLLVSAIFFLIQLATNL